MTVQAAARCSSLFLSHIGERKLEFVARVDAPIVGAIHESPAKKLEFIYHLCVGATLAVALHFATQNAVS